MQQMCLKKKTKKTNCLQSTEQYDTCSNSVYMQKWPILPQEHNLCQRREIEANSENACGAIWEFTG